ncbi:MAG: protein kinase [Dokdonella sp.]
MTKPTLSRVADILKSALDQPEITRSRWLAETCGTDLELLAALQRLLAFDQRDDLALDHSLDALVADVLAPPADDLQADARFGPFRLLQKLGEGGMGSVWLGERMDGGFRQQVALKLIRVGMESNAVAAQFRRERELLARLQHADIARLIDGGVDGAGRLWFAMEHVEGIGLREWSAQQQINLDTRLTLLVRLCLAVGYAHQHLIVHRDLKPSNVLVRADGSPCLLDFGIAKLTAGDEREETALDSRFITRAYAAPEQLRGEVVTTATDVYALGALMFEILTGVAYTSMHALGAETLPPNKALRLIREKPKAGATDHPPLHGDLDAIVARALAEEPKRRYATAQALADDIENHVKGRPVSARPDSVLYRATRFAHRNRAAVAIAAVALVLVLALSVIAMWQAHAKTIEAENARIALKRSESIRALLGSIFLSADPNASKGAATTVGELLKPARARIVRETQDDPELAAALLEQIGSTYVSLGEDALARDVLREALAFNQQAAHPSLQIEGAVEARLAHYDYLDGKPDIALQRLKAIIAKLRAGDSSLTPILAKAIGIEAGVRFAAGEMDAAVADSAESLALLKRLGEPAVVDYLNALVGFSDINAAAGRNQASLDAAMQALAHPYIRENIAPGLTTSVLGANARALQALGRNAEAEPMMVRVVGAFAASFGERSSRTYYWKYRHAQVLVELGDFDHAKAIIDDLLANPAINDQPIAHIAYLVVGAKIAGLRHAPDARERIAEAVREACSDKGNARFCGLARGLSGS